MLGRLMPREGNFFELFNAHADRIAEGSRELAGLFTQFSELEAYAQRIDGAERAADKITHETITLLHKTFITPFDREQIHLLITRMDDILDVQRDHRALIDRCMALLAPSGKLVFSNNAQKFKLDAEVGGSYEVTDISRATLPKDYERNPRIHQCFELE